MFGITGLSGIFLIASPALNESPQWLIRYVSTLKNWLTNCLVTFKKICSENAHSFNPKVNILSFINLYFYQKSFRTGKVEKAEKVLRNL